MTHDDHTSEHVYGLIEEAYYSDTGCRVAYGIAVYAHPAETGSASIIASVRDITADRAAADDLIRQCNEGALSPIHLWAVVDDRFGT